MLGLIQDYPLTVQHIFGRAEQLYPGREMVSRLPRGIERTTYGEWAQRTRRLATALKSLGVGKSDRVATFSWNHSRHVEAYFAAPCMGAVLHALNVRLSVDQLAYIIDHAEDQVVIVDSSLVGLLAPVAERVRSVRHYIIIDDGEPPTAQLPGEVHDYDSLVRESEPMVEWPELDERDASAICYTSGTTGNPKGVLYHHRAMFLHSLLVGMVDSLAVCRSDSVLCISPMFHANAWGLPFTAAMVGAKMVFPGRFQQAPDLLELIQQERVTKAMAAVTLWLAIGQELAANRSRYDTSTLKEVLAGAQAPPRALMEQFWHEFGIGMHTGWGMTETGPLAAFSRIPPEHADVSEEERLRMLSKQGYILPSVDFRVVDDEGRLVPRDGESMGELQVKGPCIASAYYRPDTPHEESFDDGWLKTKDIVVVDPIGCIHLVDRTKDVIKSGGEWISSVELENLLMAHPDVAEAAVIAIPHPRWLERPRAYVVAAGGREIDVDELLAYLTDKVAKWWLPDEIVVIDEIPKTSVGKFDKKALRAAAAAG